MYELANWSALTAVLWQKGVVRVSVAFGPVTHEFVHGASPFVPEWLVWTLMVWFGQLDERMKDRKLVGVVLNICFQKGHCKSHQWIVRW